MVAAIIEGPQQPTHLDVLLRPVIEVLENLQTGIKAEDYKGNSFLLRGWPLMISGDIPALSKMLKLSGHNATYPCRYCLVKKESGKPPLGQSVGTTGSMVECNFRKVRSKVHYRDLEEYMNDARLGRNGLKAPPALLLQSSVISLRQFPDFIPVDSMHCILQNFVPMMWKYWISNFSRIKWRELGKYMQKQAHLTPPSFGRAPGNIFAHSSQFKAEEWKNWLLIYSLPLLKTFDFPPHLL